MKRGNLIDSHSAIPFLQKDYCRGANGKARANRVLLLIGLCLDGHLPFVTASRAAMELQTAVRHGLNFGASAKSVQSRLTIRHLRNASCARTVLRSMALSASL